MDAVGKNHTRLFTLPGEGGGEPKGPIADGLRSLFGDTPGVAQLFEKSGSFREHWRQLAAAVVDQGVHVDDRNGQPLLAALVKDITDALGEGAGKTAGQALSVWFRARLAQSHLRDAKFETVRAAVSSFSDLETDAEQRRTLIRDALGKDTVEDLGAVRNGLAAALPGRSLGQTGKQLDAALGQKVFGGAGAYLDRALGMRDGDTRAISDLLQTVRNVVEVEMENLAQVALRVPESNRPEIRAAAKDYAQGLAELLLGEDAPEVKALIGRAHEQWGGANALWNMESLGAELKGSQELLGRVAKNAAQNLAAPAAATEERQQQLAALNQRFTERISASIEATPESRAALGELTADAAAFGRSAFYLAQMARAIADKSAPAAERELNIKIAAERSGNLFLKLIQTGMNLAPFLEAWSRKTGSPIDAPVFKALKRLQDDVTPMTEKQIRKEVFESLGKSVEEAFPHGFTWEPIASGSMGQAHRAVIEVPGSLPFEKPRLVEVVVKIRRPDLEKLFNRDLRVSRLLVGVSEEAARAAVPKKYQEYVTAAFTFLNGSLEALVDSFAQERDFPREVRVMKEFRDLLASHSHLVVPRVFDSHSQGGVITMENMVGEKLGKWMDRLELAKKARGESLTRADLEGLAPEQAAKKQADLWARQTFGLEPSEITLRAEPRGRFNATVTFASKMPPSVEATVHRNGRVTTSAQVPQLSDESVAALARNLSSSFVLQNAAAHVHGDYHQGNFLILPDGKTIALLDFGQTVDLSGRMGAPLAYSKAIALSQLPVDAATSRAAEAVKTHLPYPGVPLATRAAVGVTSQLQKRAIPKLAAAMVDMSNRRFTKAERREMVRRISDRIPGKIETLRASFMKEGAEAGEAALRKPNAGLVGVAAFLSMLEEGLFLAPDYFHWFKTSLSMGGNLAVTLAGQSQGAVADGSERAATMDVKKAVNSALRQSARVAGDTVASGVSDHLPGVSQLRRAVRERGVAQLNLRMPRL